MIRRYPRRLRHHLRIPRESGDDPYVATEVRGAE